MKASIDDGKSSEAQEIRIMNDDEIILAKIYQTMDGIVFSKGPGFVEMEDAK